MQTLPAIKEVLFDLDGTLADSEALAMPVAVDMLFHVVRSAGHLVSDYDVSEFTLAAFGKSVPEMMRMLGERYEGLRFPLAIDDQIAAKTIEVLKHDCQAMTGASNAIIGLHNLRTDMSIVTSSPMNRVQATLHGTGLGVHFAQDRVFSAWDSLPTPTLKPDPAIYLHAMKTRGLAPDAVAAIEDSRSGVASARAAGIAHIVGFVGGSHIPDSRKQDMAEMLLATGAKVVIDDFRQLPTLVMGIHHSQSQRGVLIKPHGSDLSLN